MKAVTWIFLLISTIYHIQVATKFHGKMQESVNGNDYSDVGSSNQTCEFTTLCHNGLCPPCEESFCKTRKRGSCRVRKELAICSEKECLERHESIEDELRQKFIKNICMHGYPCNGFCPHCDHCCPRNICNCKGYLRRYRNSTTYREKIQKDYIITKGEKYA